MKNLILKSNTITETSLQSLVYLRPGLEEDCRGWRMKSLSKAQVSALQTPISRKMGLRKTLQVQTLGYNYLVCQCKIFGNSSILILFSLPESQIYTK